MTGPTSPTGLATTSTVSVTSVTVPKMLLSQMPAGTQIVNNDLTNSVWISENQSLTPGIGYELGAQGSCTWQYDGQPAYAILDTSATGPVNLTFGNSVSDITNPLFVAEALAIKGIPSVLVEDDLGSFTFPGLYPAGIGPIDVSKYATLGISSASSSINGVDIIVQFSDHSGKQLFIGTVAEIGRVGDPAVMPPFSVPVLGPFVQFFTTLNAGSFSLTGTNRLSDRLRNNAVTTTNIAVGSSPTFTSGVQYKLGRLGVSGGQLLEMTFSSIGFGGFHPLGNFSYFDAYGNEMVIADTGEMYASATTDTYRVTKLMQWPTSIGFVFFNATQAGGAIGGAVRLDCLGN